MFGEARLEKLLQAKASNWQVGNSSVCELADYYGGALGNCGCAMLFSLWDPDAL